MITNGPWRVIVDQGGGLWVVGPNHKEWVEQDGYVRHTGAICYFGDMEDTTPEDHANAEAIARLPALIEALRSMMLFIEPPPINRYSDGGEVADAWRMARKELDRVFDS